MRPREGDRGARPKTIPSCFELLPIPLPNAVAHVPLIIAPPAPEIGPSAPSAEPYLDQGLRSMHSLTDTAEMSAEGECSTNVAKDCHWQVEDEHTFPVPCLLISPLHIPQAHASIHTAHACSFHDPHACTSIHAAPVCLFCDPRPHASIHAAPALVL